VADIAQHDFHAKAGSRFAEQFAFTDEDGAVVSLSGYSAAEFRIRRTKHAPGSTVTTTATITGAAGTVDVVVSDTVMATLGGDGPQAFAYELWLTRSSDSAKECWVEGKLIVDDRIDP
jgi:hypothetical protein